MARHTECILAAEEALDLYLDLEDPYAEGFELCCIAQWFLNHGRHQLALAYAEVGTAALAPPLCEDALDILRKAPKASASQELRALQLLSQAGWGGHRAVPFRGARGAGRHHGHERGARVAEALPEQQEPERGGGGHGHAAAGPLREGRVPGGLGHCAEGARRLPGAGRRGGASTLKDVIGLGQAAEANVSALAAGLQLKLRDPDEALRLGHWA